jgi:hypothetical protein
MLAISDEQFVGSVTVAADAGVLRCLLIDVANELERSHPSLVLGLRDLPDAIEPALLQGELDMAIVRRRSTDDRIVETPLATWTRGIYVDPRHSLASRRSIRIADLIEERWVVFEPREIDSAAPNRWPRGFRPRPSIRVDSPLVAASAVRDCGGLVALDDPIGQRLPSLQRLDYAGLPTTRLMALHRPPVGPTGRTQAVVEAVAARARTLG